MSRRRALILSLLYCGLGQIYKGEKTKGIIFIVLYTLVIVLFVLYSSFSFLIRSFILFILILMWCMGMIDAYIAEEEDEGAPLSTKRRTIWYRMLNVLELTVISGVVITLVMATFPGFGERSVDRDRDKHKAEADRELGTEERPDGSTRLFSIQVGAFRDSPRHWFDHP